MNYRYLIAACAALFVTEGLAVSHLPQGIISVATTKELTLDLAQCKGLLGNCVENSDCCEDGLDLGCVAGLCVRTPISPTTWTWPFANGSCRWSCRLEMLYKRGRVNRVWGQQVYTGRSVPIAGISVSGLRSLGVKLYRYRHRHSFTVSNTQIREAFSWKSHYSPRCRSSFPSLCVTVHHQLTQLSLQTSTNSFLSLTKQVIS